MKAILGRTSELSVPRRQLATSPPDASAWSVWTKSSRVVATSWENDAGLNVVTFVRDGLSIRLDAPPDAASIDNDSILVTVDFPYVSAAGGTATPNARERVIFLGTTGISPTAVPLKRAWLAPAPAMTRVPVRRVGAATLQRSEPIDAKHP